MATTALIFILVGIPILWLFGLAIYFRWLHRRWRQVPAVDHRRRAAILMAAVGVTLSPYLAYKAMELRYAMARVPAPLHAIWIDYRLEENWGIGLPGDNETGFLVYRLTPASADWARRRGRRLAAALKDRTREWRQTPIVEDDDGRTWHPAESRAGRIGGGLDVRFYLDQYGFGIPIDGKRADDFNRVIAAPGSIYAYGEGGSLTVVDPAAGKVYFAYAG